MNSTAIEHKGSVILGYDAFVRCNCWKEGKTKPYPFDYGFHFDFEGFLELDLPLTDADYEKKWIAVDKWMGDCCEHPDMKAEWLRVANVSGMANFKDALAQIGWNYFPTLKAELPVVNEGATSAEQAAVMLDEIGLFIRLTDATQTAMLIDTETGESVQPYLASREGVFLHDPVAGVDMGLDLDGFFIAKRHEYRDATLDVYAITYHIQQPRLDLFRAMRFEQRRRVNHEYNVAEFMNLDTGSIFLWRRKADSSTEESHKEDHDRVVQLGYTNNVPSFASIPDGRQKRAYHVEIRARNSHDFDYTLKALFALCKAAKETGNPICWT